MIYSVVRGGIFSSSTMGRSSCKMVSRYSSWRLGTVKRTLILVCVGSVSSVSSVAAVVSPPPLETFRRISPSSSSSVPSATDCSTTSPLGRSLLTFSVFTLVKPRRLSCFLASPESLPTTFGTSAVLGPELI